MSVATVLAVLLAGSSPAVPHFDTEVIPVLTKAGCNAGACHGAAAGRGGFHLSLFGGDPASDHEAIVYALEGRRVNLARPDVSLILAKPSGQLKHGGDIALPGDGPAAKRITDWIAAGAPRGAVRRLKQFSVSASHAVVERADTNVVLRAVARFDDGPEVDVTQWTVFSASDPSALVLTEGDSVSVAVQRAGRHVVIARFLDRVQPITLTRPIGTKPVDLSGEPTANLIDEEVIATLRELRLSVSPQADDSAFLRRVRLDLTGTLPAQEEVDEYVRDRSVEKRVALVERLLKSDEFADYWTLRFARTLRARSLPNEKAGLLAYTRWLRKALNDGMSLDRMSRELLTAVGDSHTIGAANFARTTTDARGQAELVSRVFLGTRLQCANCHNHPLDRWTQDDYHGLAAVFSKLERGRVVKTGTRGDVTNLRTGEPATPRLPGERDLKPSVDSRVDFADWLTAKENPYFAKAQVNRIWRAMFGRGLVEPVDDMRATNPATHPKLLERLADDFARNGYDVRGMIRLIALSRAYGRSDRPLQGNEGDDRFYSRFQPRPLDPEVLVDAVVSVTGATHKFDGQPEGTRAITLYDPLTPSPELDLFGRCSRAAACEEGATTVGLPAKLHLLNGEFLNNKIATKTGRLARMIAEGKTDREIVTNFYRLGFARSPSDVELTGWLKRIENSGLEGRNACLQDFTWALLNSREFITNH